MKSLFAALWMIALPRVLFAQDNEVRENSFIAKNDVTWNSLGKDENDSMPAGNGDLALNAWMEQNGDLVLLIAKADAWSENGQLLKLGRVRIKLTPNPFVGAGSFAQTLKLATGEIEIKSGSNSVDLWVDANHPVIHVEVQSENPVRLEARAESWRLKGRTVDPKALGKDCFEWPRQVPLILDPDTIFPAKDNRVTWCHYNSRSIYPVVLQQEHLGSLLAKYPDPLLHRCFGVTMKGAGLTSGDDQTLQSTEAARSLRLDIYALTQQADSPDAWQAALAKQIDAIDGVSLEAARQAHRQWWKDFWDRSWMDVSGTPDAEKVSQGYAIQRWMTACAGRGAQPIKFNGSLFTVGHDLPDNVPSTTKDHDPDFRYWGACYWNQNTRLIYWPLTPSGDDDLLAPWFDLYARALPLLKDATQLYYHHDGAAFIETIYFWGLPNLNDFGWNNPGPVMRSGYMRYHIQGSLEVIAQMLDHYDCTQDDDFARTSLVPMADAVITYYDQHWPRDAAGKIHMEPAQSIETYQVDVINPTPDLAGLMSVLPRLRALPDRLTTPAQRELWSKVLKDLPALPMGTTAGGKTPPNGRGDPDGKPVILPAQQYAKTSNGENAELYAVFPYRLYGVGKPDLELARNTYFARRFPSSTGWGQDSMQAAVLGLTDEAKSGVVKEFTAYGGQRFPWFWRPEHDWIPNVENGGAGREALQLMLMQCDGRRIQLLPAWPLDWTCDFKLHAPCQTTVEGHVEGGKLTRLKVTPQERAADVVVVPQR